MKIQIIEEHENEYNELCRFYNIEFNRLFDHAINKLLDDKLKENKKWKEEIEKYRNSKEYNDRLKLIIQQPISKTKNNIHKNNQKKNEKELLDMINYKLV